MRSRGQGGPGAYDQAKGGDFDTQIAENGSAITTLRADIEGAKAAIAAAIINERFILVLFPARPCQTACGQGRAFIMNRD